MNSQALKDAPRVRKVLTKMHTQLPAGKEFAFGKNRHLVRVVPSIGRKGGCRVMRKFALVVTPSSLI